MNITSTEFQNHIEKYLSLSATKDIYIPLNNNVVAKFPPHQDKIDTAKSLFGILPSSASLDIAREKHLHTNI